MPGAVEDCQGVYDERRRNSGQEEAAAAEKTVVGRPDRSTDVHQMHRIASVDRCRLQSSRLDFGRPDRSTGEGLCKQPNSLFVSVDRLGRP